MIDTYPHTTHENVPESPVQQLLSGVKGILRQQEIETYRWRQQCEQYEAQVQALPTPTNIVADGKQKKLIAILNAIYEGGYVVNITKKEFMQRAAEMLGCPGIADYNKALYNVKNTYAYDEIFTDLAQVAHNEIIKNDG